MILSIKSVSVLLLFSICYFLTQFLGVSHTLAESTALVVSSGSVCAIDLATAAGLAARRTVCVYMF